MKAAPADFIPPPSQGSFPRPSVWERHEIAILTALSVITLVGILIAKLDVSEMTKLTIGCSTGTALLLGGGIYIYNVHRAKRNGDNLFEDPKWWLKEHYQFVLVVLAMTAIAAIIVGYIDVDAMTRLIAGCSIAAIPVVLGILYDISLKEGKHKNCFKEETHCLINESKWLKIIYLHCDASERADLNNFIDNVVEHERLRLPAALAVDDQAVEHQPNGPIVLKLIVMSRAYRAAQEERESSRHHEPGEDRYGATLD